MSRKMGLKLENARIEANFPYTILKVEIEGRTAILDPQPKPTIHEAGLVSVGEEFRDILPDRTITVDGRETELVGFSDDPRLFKLYDDYLIACNRDRVPYGSFPIPDLDEGEPDPEF